MKRIFNYLLRLILILASFLAMILLLNSPVQVKINNAPGFAKKIIRQATFKSGNENLKAANNLLSASGIEDQLLSELPHNLHFQFSYWNLYQLSQKYEKQGELTAADLGLNSNNELVSATGRAITQQVNKELENNQEEIRNDIKIYQFAIWLIILLFALAVLLLLFNRRGASLPLFLGSLLSFAGLDIFCQQLQPILQANLYSGITVSINELAWLGLGIGLFVAIIWPFVRRSFSRK